MLTLIHGDNQVASRNTLKQLIDGRDNQNEIIKLNGETLNLTDLKQALESHSLFGQDKLIVIENVFSRVKSKEKDQIIDYIKKEKHDNEIIIWEKKSVHPSTVRSLHKTTKVVFHKISPLIFKFLDSLKPGNPKISLTIFQNLKKTDVPEMIFYMLSRRISDLIVVKDAGKQALNNMQQWQQSKLLTQSKLFQLSQLIDIHEKLYKIDKNMKTGKNILPLVSQLDLLLIEI